MNDNIIVDQFKEIVARQRTATFYKVDFHIHTPGSKRDYKVNGVEYEKVGLEDLEKIAKEKGLYKNFKGLYSGKDELMALLIVNAAYKEKDLNLIVLTDHNNMDWYSKIYDAVPKYIANIANTTEKAKQFMILPGVEITCFSGTHVIGIFDFNNYEKVWECIKFELNGLNEIKQKTFTFKSEMDVIKTIKKFNGIVYIPHLDNNAAKQKITDILDPLSGMSKAQLLTSKFVDAIGFRNPKFSEIAKQTLENKNHVYYRKSALAYLQDSDAHCIEDIGKHPMYVKMDKPCFNSLKFALKDPKLRIKSAIETKKDIPFIRGVITRGGYLSKNQTEYSYYPFCKELNCIIGGRGSGKSTLIKCLNSCLTGITPSNDFRLFMGNFICILVYIHVFKKDYCVLCEPKIQKDEYSGKEINRYGDPKIRGTVKIADWLNVYEIKKNSYKRLNKIKQFELLNNFKICYFDQAEIYQIGTSQSKLKDFFKSIILRSEYKDNYLELNKKLEEIYKKSYQDVIYKNISKLKDLYDKIKCLKLQIDSTISEVINILNQSIKNKVIIRHERKNLSDSQLLFDSLDNYKFNNKLNGYQTKKLSRLIDYISEKYTLFDINKRVIENKEILMNEIKKSKKLEAENSDEVENDDTSFEKYIDIFFCICKRALENLIRNKDSENYKVEFNVNSHELNERNIKFKKLSELSLGQRAVAILTIITEGMTVLDVNIPLIIDQPEDQLDNRFIYEHLIKSVRGLKEKRQIIFVTHNANIPVSGDAENVMCLSSNNENGWLDIYGSLDNDNIKNRIIEILEGGKESFKLRLRKYNVN